MNGINIRVPQAESVFAFGNLEFLEFVVPFRQSCYGRLVKRSGVINLMNIDEIIAFEYLKKLEIGKPVYEPFGNRPPDFSIDNLAVEVRRLNQNYFKEGKVVGLENFGMVFPDIVEEVFRGFDAKYSGLSYWVAVKYKRAPDQKMSNLKKELKLSLQQFLNIRTPLPYTLDVTDEIDISFYESTPFEGKIFQIGSLIDYDSGGWVLSLYIENIKHSLQEKIGKILPYKNDFQKWWLLLVDRIGFTFHEDEIDELKKYVGIIEQFEKVIVVSPINYSVILTL